MEQCLPSVSSRQCDLLITHCSVCGGVEGQEGYLSHHANWQRRHADAYALTGEGNILILRSTCFHPWCKAVWLTAGCCGLALERSDDWQFSGDKTRISAQKLSQTRTAIIIFFFLFVFIRSKRSLVIQVNKSTLPPFAGLWHHRATRVEARRKSNKIPLYYPAVGCLWQGLGPDYARVLPVSSVAYCISTNRITRTDGQAAYTKHKMAHSRTQSEEDVLFLLLCTIQT